MYYGNSFNYGRIRTGRAVLVAISIPIFTSQLEKSRDAVTVSNLRAAYAQAAADVLTKQTDTASMTSTQTVSISGATGDLSGLESELPFDLSEAQVNTLGANKGKTVDVTFTWTTTTTGGDGSSVTTAAEKPTVTLGTVN